MARNSVGRENNIVRQCDNVEFRQRPELRRLVLQCVDHVALAVDGTRAAEFEKVVGEQQVKFARGLAQIGMQQTLLERENVFAKGCLHYAPQRNGANRRPAAAGAAPACGTSVLSDGLGVSEARDRALSTLVNNRATFP